MHNAQRSARSSRVILGRDAVHVHRGGRSCTIYAVLGHHPSSNAPVYIVEALCTNHPTSARLSSLARAWLRPMNARIETTVERTFPGST